MTLRFGLTVVDIEVSTHRPPRLAGRLGPDDFGKSRARLFWCWPVAVLVLTDRPH